MEHQFDVIVAGGGPAGIGAAAAAAASAVLDPVVEVVQVDGLNGIAETSSSS